VCTAWAAVRASARLEKRECADDGRSAGPLAFAGWSGSGTGDLVGVEPATEPALSSPPAAAPATASASSSRRHPIGSFGEGDASAVFFFFFFFAD
jgi:hypothetical protein